MPLHRSIRFLPLTLAILGQALLLASAAPAQNDVAMRAMKDELSRTMSQLQLQKMDKPYFIAYRMDDINQVSVSAMLGSLTASQPSLTRLLAVEVRVGDYAVDNTNYVSMQNLAGGMAGMFSAIRQAPIDDNYQQTRRSLWLATDSQYKKALEDLSAKRGALAAQNRSDRLPDFSKETLATDIQPEVKFTDNRKPFEDLAKALSGVFKGVPELYNSSVDMSFSNHYTRYINSEGSAFTRPQLTMKLQVNAQALGPDGVPISDSFIVYGHTFEDLPSQADLVARTHAMADRLLKLRAASTLERYNGPVLFEAEAGPEIFSQQFAPGLTTVRTPISDDPRMGAAFDQILSQLGGASYADKVGGRILPDFLNVSDKPSAADLNGVRLFGSAKLDDDAVLSRQTNLIEHGILKTLLAARVPTRIVPQSTGSRHGWGAAPSNLFVTSDKSLTKDDLRKELLRRAKERGLDYAIVVRHVGGGNQASFMKMAARMAQQGGQDGGSLAEAYKLFPDGHEELLQGAEISELTPALFKDIVAVGDTPAVYTDEFIPRMGALFSVGFSAPGDLPLTSVIAPSMLFEELTVVKSQGPYQNPPVEPSPLAKN